MQVNFPALLKSLPMSPTGHPPTPPCYSGVETVHQPTSGDVWCPGSGPQQQSLRRWRVHWKWHNSSQYLHLWPHNRHLGDTPESHQVLSTHHLPQQAVAGGRRGDLYWSDHQPALGLWGRRTDLDPAPPSHANQPAGSVSCELPRLPHCCWWTQLWWTPQHSWSVWWAPVGDSWPTTREMLFHDVHQPWWTLLSDGWLLPRHLCVLHLPTVPCWEGYSASSHLTQQHWPDLSLEDTHRYPTSVVQYYHIWRGTGGSWWLDQPILPTPLLPSHPVMVTSWGDAPGSGHNLHCHTAHWRDDGHRRM